MAAAGLALAVIAIAVGTVQFLGAMALVPASIGFVFSVIGLVQARGSQRGRWLAIPGIVLSIAAACWVPVAAALIPRIVSSVTLASVDSAPIPAEPAAVAPTPVAQTRSLAPPPPRNQYSPPSMRRQPTTPSGPTLISTTPPADVQSQRTVEAAIAELASDGKGTFEDTWPDAIVKLRRQIDAIDDESARERLHGSLDDAQMALVEADAAAALASASAAYDAGSAAEAETILEAVAERRLDAGETVTYAMPTTPSLAAAVEFQGRLAMLRDPSQRYVPRGIVGGSRGIRVTLHDGLTGENQVVEEGSTLDDGSVVTSIQAEAHSIELTRNGSHYSLNW